MGAFSYQRSLTIDHTQCGASDSINFPVLVSASDASLKDAAHGGHVQSSSGTDILFFSDPGLTVQLPSEIDSYNPGYGVLVAWVQVPTISHTADTVIYIAYGNSAPPARTAGVWDANYKGVWHLGDGSALSTADSTATGNGLTNTGGAAATGGKVAGGASFNGTTQSMSTSGSVNFGGARAGTVEFWMKPASLSSVAIMLETSTNFNTNAGGILIDPAGESGGKWGFVVSKGDSVAYNGVYLNTNPTTGAWHHVAMVIDLASTVAGGQGVKVYVDGALASVTQHRSSDLSNIALGNFPAYLMARNNSQYRQAGSLDEVRVSNVARSAGWIWTEYANQNTPGNIGSAGFLTWGTETRAVGTTWAVAGASVGSSSVEASISSLLSVGGGATGWSGVFGSASATRSMCGGARGTSWSDSHLSAIRTLRGEHGSISSGSGRMSLIRALAGISYSCSSALGTLRWLVQLTTPAARVIEIAAENREIQIPVEIRSFPVPAEKREFLA